jgi:hypothetical protein
MASKTFHPATETLDTDAWGVLPANRVGELRNPYHKEAIVTYRPDGGIVIIPGNDPFEEGDKDDDPEAPIVEHEDPITSEFLDAGAPFPPVKTEFPNLSSLGDVGKSRLVHIGLWGLVVEAYTELAFGNSALGAERLKLHAGRLKSYEAHATGSNGLWMKLYPLVATVFGGLQGLTRTVRNKVNAVAKVVSFAGHYKVFRDRTYVKKYEDALSASRNNNATFMELVSKAFKRTGAKGRVLGELPASVVDTLAFFKKINQQQQFVFAVNAFFQVADTLAREWEAQVELSNNLYSLVAFGTSTATANASELPPPPTADV